MLSLCVIERRFYFPPHLSSATTLPLEITEKKMTNFAASNILFCESTTLNNILFSHKFFQSKYLIHWYWWLGLLTCKNRLPYNLYCVGGDVKHCSLTHSQNTKNDQFHRKKHTVLWINNVLWHVWLLETSAKTARHHSNTGRSPSPQSYPLVTRQRTP